MRGSNQMKAGSNSWGKGLQWMYVVCTWVFWPFVNNENLDFFSCNINGVELYLLF